MEIRPINPATVQDQVYDELLGAIISGRIPPGEKLTIEGLATRMEVSLMPVRVALQKLQAGGFVHIGRNRRIKVTQLTDQDLNEILELRLMLEGHAAEKACKNRSEEALNKLERLHRECVNAKDENTYLRANRSFHGLIYRESGMPILEEMIASLWARVSPYLHILLRNEENWGSKKWDPFHLGMVEAMRRKDPGEMRRWLTEDLTEAAKRMKELMDQMREA
jgi:DNA-binding GntR family transcriptional regulator